jgi:predicted nucleotidyltransferase
LPTFDGRPGIINGPTKGWHAVITELTRHQGELVRLCRRYGVTRLDVFGSAASGEFDPRRSDVDFLVEIDPPAGSSRFEAYFGFKEEIEAVLGRAVDLVDPSALANPYFAEAVERTREPLYAA